MNTRPLDFSAMVDGRHTRMDHLRVKVGHLWRLRTHLPDVIDDLLDVAMAVYAADRLVRRTRSADFWQPRQMEVRVPVADPERWAALAAQLSELLRWLTTDQWQLTFTPLTTGRVRPASGLHAPQVEHPFVALYSGGLDSFAGAVAQAHDPAFDGGVLVGAQSANRLKRLQAEQHQALQRNLPAFHWEPLQGFGHALRLTALGAWNIAEQKQEKSQRSRAFLFMMFGAATAFGYGTDRLYVYENGVGAINLPYTPSFSGADMTRAMHPRTLLLTSRFLTDLFGTPFKIENPSQWRTKGEMCAQLKALNLGDLAVMTKSCDSFPLREARDQCGLCTSCLLRRISLHAGGLRGLEQDQAHYRQDIYTLNPEANDPDLKPFGFMQQQAQAIQQSLASGDFLDFRLQFDLIDEARYAIEELTGWTPTKTDRHLADLYRRYAAEVHAFHQELPGPQSRQGAPHDEHGHLQRT